MKYSLSFSLLLIILTHNCGPKTEKALSYVSAGSVGQLYPEQPWRYSPEYVFDGKQSTAFCADSKQTDSGFTIYLSNHSEFSAISFINGFAKSSLDASQNAQVKKLKITAIVQAVSDNKTKVNSEDSVIVELPLAVFSGNEAKVQSVDLNKTLKGNVIRFEFLDTHKGSKFTDVCLSELIIGQRKDNQFQKYPVSNEERIKTLIAGYEEASRHYYAFKKLITANEVGSINFLNQNLVLPVFFKPDFTFSFSEMYGGNPEAGMGGMDSAKQGSYTILSSSAHGIEINLSYFDANGLEKNDTWIFRRASAGDEDFEYFKTKLGTTFSEVYNPKTHYLLFLKEVNTSSSYYNYEIPFK
ncbi:MAG: hypothetical protein SH817_13195 [Leptospira sp.]|nr:hypothetical protein [Leptospira sp.]